MSCKHSDLCSVATVGTFVLGLYGLTGLWFDTWPDCNLASGWGQKMGSPWTLWNLARSLTTVVVFLC